MKIKDILESLEEIENNEDKLKYLKEILKRIDDKEIIKEIKDIIDELEEGLENKLDKVEISHNIRREMQFDEAESDIELQERQIRQRPLIRNDLNLSNLDNEKEVRYESIN